MKGSSHRAALSNLFLLILTGIVLAALVQTTYPHARAVFRTGRDLHVILQFRRKVKTEEFRKKECPDWTKSGLVSCFAEEIRRQGLLQSSWVSTRVMLHGVVTSLVLRATEPLKDARFRNFVEAVEFFDFDLTEELRRSGKVIALKGHDPLTGRVFDPRVMDRAEAQAARALNGRLWKMFDERASRMRTTGNPEGVVLSPELKTRLDRAYRTVEQWRKKIQWMEPEDFNSKN